MGLFNRFKKNATPAQVNYDRIQNDPEMLITKLLYVSKPVVIGEQILELTRQHITRVECISDKSPVLFSFPDFPIGLQDTEIRAQCTVLFPEAFGSEIDIPEEVYQQNWDWNEGAAIAKTCRYELIVTDLMSRSMEYKKRMALFDTFLKVIVRATRPDAVYSLQCQKLIDPKQLLDNVHEVERSPLFNICNVRLYNVANTNELLMDTIGLHSIGLTDFQIKFSGYPPNEIARILWNYAYYVYDKGDIVENGNTFEGVIDGSKWRCERGISLLEPQRVVINLKIG